MPSTQGSLEERLLTALALSGQSTAPDLARRLGVSQSSFSRLTSQMGNRLLVTGRARGTRYAARRVLADVGDRLPIYAVNARGRAEQIATLHALLPESFYVETHDARIDSGFYADLPYFLDDLRPAGFLGRMVPGQHPELDAPSDVRLWSASHVVRYAGRFGWNLPGNLILGNEAFARYVEHAAHPPDVVAPSTRRARYAKLAAGVLSATPGSSAGGEQPKFLASRPGGEALLVKFSPPLSNAVGRRASDLLVAEQVAHETLRRHGRAAPRSRLFQTTERMYLEVERFDRTPEGGRRGVVSLLTLDAQFAGRMRTWSDSVEALVLKRVLEPAMLDSVRWLELFGQLIGNSDMHGGNLSFFAEGMRVKGLTPTYDMSPARYAGQGGNIASAPLSLPPPTPRDAAVWDSASRAATDFWRKLAVEPKVSKGFQKLGELNASEIVAWRKLGALLPAPLHGSARRRTRGV